MEHYYLMVILTGVVIVLGILIWLKTRNVAFPVGIFFLYYWSLYGAWSLITDKLGGSSGKHYFYLEDKIFPIQLDSYYYWSLAFYGLFVIIVAMTVLITAAPASCAKTAAAHRPLVISHTALMALAAIAGVLSFVIIYPNLETARSLNVSVYSFKAGDHSELSPLFTVYNELNRVALMASAIGLAVVASGKNPRYLAGNIGTWIAPGHLAILGLMIIEAILMGDKSQMVFTGVAAVLFYLVNAERPRYLPLAALGAVGFMGLAAVDMLRGVPLPLLLKALTSTTPAEWGDVAQFFSDSDEAFGAHFSMYGALSFHLEPTYGSSFTSLAASIVPRAFWENRPDDIYSYYADGVRAMPGQGYSIHHATGWYLNFGVPGIVLGAILLGGIWACCYNLFHRAAEGSSRWLRIFALIVPWTFTANLPMLVRAGPEAYKGVCLEVFLIPTLLLWIASHDWRRSFRHNIAVVPEITA